MGRVPRQRAQLPGRRGPALSAAGRALRAALRLAGAAAAAGLATGPTLSASAATVRDGRYVMGTALELTVRAPDPARARAAADAVFAEVARLEALLSTFDPESQVSRLNRAAGGPRSRCTPTWRRSWWTRAAGAT